MIQQYDDMTIRRFDIIQQYEMTIGLSNIMTIRRYDDRMIGQYDNMVLDIHRNLWETLVYYHESAPIGQSPPSSE